MIKCACGAESIGYAERCAKCKTMFFEPFFKQMATRLNAIKDIARTTERYCLQDEPEGCVLYEHLLNLLRNVEGAVSFYKNEVPATDRQSIIRMMDVDMGNDKCTCAERSWYGTMHDSACAMAGRLRNPVLATDAEIRAAAKGKADA